MDQNTKAQLVFEANKKSLLIAYILWWFLGTFGVHRLYLGKVGSALAMAIVTLLSFPLVFLLVGYIGFALIALWWLIDAFLLPGMVRDRNLALIGRIETAQNRM